LFILKYEISRWKIARYPLSNAASNKSNLLRLSSLISESTDYFEWLFYFLDEKSKNQCMYLKRGRGYFGD